MSQSWVMRTYGNRLERPKLCDIAHGFTLWLFACDEVVDG